MPINFRYEATKATVVDDISECGVFVQHPTSLHNVSGMSWPVTYSEVATLAQEFLEGLSPRTSEMMVFKPLPTRLISVPDGWQWLL